MQCNVGKTDKNIRLILGALIVLWGIFYQSWWGIVGLILLATAFISWCPVYAVLGIKTCEHKKGGEVKTASEPDKPAEESSQPSSSEMSPSGGDEQKEVQSEDNPTQAGSGEEAEKREENF